MFGSPKTYLGHRGTLVVNKKEIVFFAFVCQAIILPQLYTAAAANVLNLIVNYVLIISLQLGVM